MKKDYEVVIKYLEESEKENTEVMRVLEDNKELIEQTEFVIQYTYSKEPVLISRS